MGKQAKYFSLLVSHVLVALFAVLPLLFVGGCDFGPSCRDLSGVTDFAFVTESHVVLSTEIGGVVASYDGGVSWQTMSRFPAKSSCSTRFINQLAVGADQSLWGIVLGESLEGLKVRSHTENPLPGPLPGGEKNLFGLALKSFLPLGVFTSYDGGMTFVRVDVEPTTGAPVPTELISRPNDDPLLLDGNGQLMSSDSTMTPLRLRPLGAPNQEQSGHTGTMCADRLFVTSTRPSRLWSSGDLGQTWNLQLDIPDADNSTKLSCGPSGDVWLTVSRARVYYYNPNMDAWSVVTDISDHFTAWSTAATHASLYLGGIGPHETAVVFQVQTDGTVQELPGLPGNHVESLHFALDGILWAAAHGLHKWDSERFVWHQVWP